MSAFNSHDFTNASVETDAYNNKVTQFGVFATGLLFTAYYSAANTVTLQFTSTDPAFLTAASSTTSLYTLSGPSAPSVTSISFTPGTRLVTLNLSGPLVSTNTYTLKIADWTVINGEQANFSGLTVDIILPLDLNCVGVGIAQVIALDDPSAQNAGTAQMIGITQAVDLGTPVITAVAATHGVGIAETITLGNPAAGLFATAVGVGFSQPIALGTPVVTQQQEPVGVGFSQPIALGTPVADINPLTPIGVGIQQTVTFGNPVAAGSGDIVGVGLAQLIALGLPLAHKDNEQDVFGIGIAEIISLGVPSVAQTAPTLNLFLNGLGVEIPVELGLPNVRGSKLVISACLAGFFPSLDAALQQAFGDGVQGVINPNLVDPIRGYLGQFNGTQQHQTKVVFEDAAAAFMDALNLPCALPITNNTDTVTLAPASPPATQGQLQFVDGILVAYTPPVPIIIG